MLPMQQADFSPGKNTTEQVLALTFFVEAGFEKRLKTGNVLSAAYDTVWHNGLMLKLIKIIKCKKTIELLKRMAGPRDFTVLLGGDLSKTENDQKQHPTGVGACTYILQCIHFNVTYTRTNDSNLQEKWKQDWHENIPTGGDLIEDPTNLQPSFHPLTRKQWTTANRIRTRHGRTAANLHKWSHWISPTCRKCHDARQDRDHIVLY